MIKRVPQFPDYGCDELGNVYSLKFGKIRKLKPGNVKGYLQVGLQRDKKQYHKYVQVIVLETFVGPCPPGMEACHNDGDKNNCALSNLRWDTRESNQEDNLMHGVSGTARLKELEVVEILSLKDKGLSESKVAEMFNVDQSTINRIWNRKTWRYL